jgi:hypothetical protein
VVSSWISPKARKGISSRIAGRGLFATEQISSGELVAVKGGHIVTTKQLLGHDWRRRDLQLRYRGYFSSYLQQRIDGMHADAP